MSTPCITHRSSAGIPPPRLRSLARMGFRHCGCAHWRGGDSATSYRRRRNDVRRRMRGREKMGGGERLSVASDTISAAHLFPLLPRTRYTIPRRAASSGTSFSPVNAASATRSVERNLRRTPVCQRGCRHLYRTPDCNGKNTTFAPSNNHV